MIRKELRRCYRNHTLQARTTKRLPRCNLSGVHPLYKCSKKQISKQAAADPRTKTKTTECVPISKRRPETAVSSKRRLCEALACPTPSFDGKTQAGVEAPAASVAIESFAAVAGDAALEGTAELRDLLKQNCVRHRPDQVQQLIAAGRAKRFTIQGIIAFVAEKIT